MTTRDPDDELAPVAFACGVLTFSCGAVVGALIGGFVVWVLTRDWGILW